MRRPKRATEHLRIVPRRSWERHSAAIASVRDLDRDPIGVAAPASLAWLVFAAAYAYTIARPVRWKWVVVCVMAIGSLVISFLPADLLAAMANDSPLTHPVLATLVGTMIVSFMTYGAMLLVSGSISLWLYLRNTHVPLEEGQ